MPAEKDQFLKYFLHYQDQLRAACYAVAGDPHLAEDIFQETSLACWKSFAQFDPEKATCGFTQIKSDHTQNHAMGTTVLITPTLYERHDSLHTNQCHQRGVSSVQSRCYIISCGTVFIHVLVVTVGVIHFLRYSCSHSVRMLVSPDTKTWQTAST